MPNCNCHSFFWAIFQFHNHHCFFLGSHSFHLWFVSYILRQLFPILVKYCCTYGSHYPNIACTSALKPTGHHFQAWLCSCRAFSLPFCSLESSRTLPFLRICLEQGQIKTFSQAKYFYLLCGVILPNNHEWWLHSQITGWILWVNEGTNEREILHLLRCEEGKKRQHGFTLLWRHLRGDKPEKVHCNKDFFALYMKNVLTRYRTLNFWLFF